MNTFCSPEPTESAISCQTDLLHLEPQLSCKQVASPLTYSDIFLQNRVGYQVLGPVGLQFFQTFPHVYPKGAFSAAILDFIPPTHLSYSPFQRWPPH